MNRKQSEPGRPAARAVGKNAGEIIRPTASHPFVNFHYSYSEVSAHGGKARLKSRKTRFEDGKLRSEAFEGELDRTTYEQTMAGAQRYFAEHAALLTRSLSLFLPFPGKQDSDRD